MHSFIQLDPRQMVWKACRFFFCYFCLVGLGVFFDLLVLLWVFFFVWGGCFMLLLLLTTVQNIDPSHRSHRFPCDLNSPQPLRSRSSLLNAFKAKEQKADQLTRSRLLKNTIIQWTYQVH